MSNAFPTAAAIHDLSGVGKCSLTVALPILSACGVETSVLPTAVLSTHTGGFTDYVYIDLTDYMTPIADHWKSVGCHFDALYTGFLGSAGQIDIVDRIFTQFGDKDTKIVIDPVMGDNGKLYPTYTDEMADGIARLSRRANVLVPNMTEASRILGIPYKEGPYTKEYMEEVLHSLSDLGPSQVVLTGIWFEEGKLGAACYDRKAGKTDYTLYDRIPGYFHGTGDTFASVLTGALLRGLDLFAAAQLATEFTWKTIVTTADTQKDLRFGPKFEHHLPWLCETLANKA